MTTTDRDGQRAPAMRLDRFRELLDAYGADPQRWPVDERDAALALLSASDAAKALRESASRLDALLERVAVAPPSEDLVRRVLAGAPARRRAVWRGEARRRMAVGAVAALAAGVLLWVASQGVRRGGEPLQVTYEGEYAMPSDVLLTPPGVDLAGTEPVVGCAEEGWGCSISNTEVDTQSRGAAVEGMPA